MKNAHRHARLFRARIASFAALLAVIALASSLSAAPGRYLDAAAYDLAGLLPAPPPDDSLATRAELETVYQAQLARTPAQAELARRFDAYSVFHFDSVLGSWFNAENLPFTAVFFEQILADRKAISDTAKNIWNRPRPPLFDKSIRPLLELPSSGAYPSGHSTQAHLWAGLLAAAFPMHGDALRARARELAWSRVVAGVHYPSDIIGGRILGERLAADFLKNAEVQDAIARIRAEAAPFQKSSATGAAAAH
ncbi:phosphatase PAP2 family protein [Termitidicoccus mucosus]|uniref:Acid phosphatase n=1 Tax=Termitidicoccus mucosus TaxID=1184151 RepID=A0A178IF05_9BACT|nr:hypothetical protein AW736_20940 [Opitutaceae bacterium TSB47]